MPETSRENLDSTIARLVVDRGLATSDEVERARQQVQDGEESAAGQSLADVLVDEGLVTQAQMSRLKPEIEERKADRQIPGYQIVAKLGAGAMATVYKARQLSLDRLVAIKVLPQRYTAKPEFVERFYAEGKAAAKLNHANIVQAYDVGKAGDFHYFVMEYVEGRTVFDDITSHGPYDEQTALDIAVQITKALEHAHNAGFIHRDVKPKNIMITEEGVAKLADMGLARAISDREAAEAEAGKAYGTPYYISPEQIRGEVDIDFRADIYSFGATLYHMVTGRVPFDGPNPSAVMHRHLKAELTPPDHVRPELSGGVGEVIEVCMAKKRDQRYSSTADLLRDLEAVARGEPPIQARKAFDINQLSALEAGEASIDEEQRSEAVPLSGQPIFWVAVMGWVMAVVFLVGMILLAVS